MCSAAPPAFFVDGRFGAADLRDFLAIVLLLRHDGTASVRQVNLRQARNQRVDRVPYRRQLGNDIDRRRCAALRVESLVCRRELKDRPALASSLDRPCRSVPFATMTPRRAPPRRGNVEGLATAIDDHVERTLIELRAAALEEQSGPFVSQCPRTALTM